MHRRVPFVLLTAALLAGTATTPVLAQAATASLAGTVTSASGDVLADVCVELLGPSSADEVRTTSDGGFRFDGLEPGEYFVGFNTCSEPRPGQAAEYFRDAPSLSSATPVVLREGQQRTGVNAQLEPAGTLSGTVVGQDTQRGLAEVCVAAVSSDEDGLFAETTTASDGSYALANLRPADYLVVFADCTDPFTYLGELYDDVPFDMASDREPTPVTVVGGSTTSGIDAELEQGGSLTGTLTGLHTGRPLSLVCAGLVEPGGDAEADPAGFAVSGLSPSPGGSLPAGEYVFGGVRAGSYDVVSGDGGLCGDDGYERAVAAGQQVRVGQVTRGVDLVLTPRPSISFACSPETTEPPFRDVSADDVHAAAVQCIAEYGIAEGRDDGTYGPDRPVQRDQMAAFIARTLTALGVDLPSNPPNRFPDDDASVHRLAIDQLAALGVVSGQRDGRFVPNGTVSRDQMATFLVNGYERATGFPLRAAGNAFTDDDASVHAASIDKAATAGLVAGGAGGTAGTYAPSAQVRRGPMGSFVARLLDRAQRDLADPAEFGPQDGSFSTSGMRAALEVTGAP